MWTLRQIKTLEWKAAIGADSSKKIMFNRIMSSLEDRQEEHTIFDPQMGSKHDRLKFDITKSR